MVRVYSDLVLSDNLDELTQSIEQMSEHLVFLYCESGSLQYTVYDQAHMVRPGQVLVCTFPTLTGHYMRTPDFEAKMLAVGKHFFDHILNDCLEVDPNWWQKAVYVRDNPVMSITDFQTRLIKAYYTLIIIYTEDASNPNRQLIIRTMAQAVAYEILGCLDEQIATQSPIPLKTAMGAKDRVLSQFMQLLHEPDNYMRDVQSYAHRLLITPKYLSSVCKELTNRTAFEWINQTISEHIDHFLTRTDLSIKEIAYRMDFPDVSFFCKFTRKNLGQSPGEYRRTHTHS